MNTYLTLSKWALKTVPESLVKALMGNIILHMKKWLIVEVYVKINFKKIRFLFETFRRWIQSFSFGEHTEISAST